MIKSNPESASAEAEALHEGAAAVESSAGAVDELSSTNTPSSAECATAYDTAMAQATSAGAYVDERSELALKIDAVFQDIDAQMAMQ